MTFIFFNLLVNSIFSLAIGLMLVQFFIWFFRVGTTRWKVFLLSLPFLKIVYDFARGVPEKSVLFSGVDPFSLPPKHQLLSIGAGLDGWTPYVSTVFSVNGLDGTRYNSSIGDYLLIWVHRTFGENIPLIIVTGVLSISLTLLAIRLVQYVRFERQRRLDRTLRAGSKSLALGRRQVDVYVSDAFSGTPFTGGLFKPYICLPADAVQKLTSQELEAVIAHELGHVRYYDLLVTVLIQTLGDLFWFIPGYRSLSRKIDRLREIVADGWAVASGAHASSLAAALLKLKEIPDTSHRLVLYSAFFREKSLLKERIERLVGRTAEKSPRFGWENRWIRYASAVFISIVVLNSVFGGNFKDEALMKTPAWVDGLFETSCLCIGHKFYARS